MKISRTIALLILFFSVYWSFQLPESFASVDLPITEFSAQRAAAHVKEISKEPHYLGSQGNNRIREYIVWQLTKMGLQVSVQEDFVVNNQGILSRPKNILARIEGSTRGKSLLLMSHYDSAPNGSLGAGDAACGVATILEGIRAFLEKKEMPKNDIIILISDGKEIGLSGPQLFAKKHPWAKDIGLVLNFEARGSSGPSHAIIETNKGNKELIREFGKAGLEHPIANSFYYSLHEIFSSKTGLTTFKEDHDIQGFNFSFIDDPYDHHTELDNYERLDRFALEHQGSYLLPLLNHFAYAELDTLTSLDNEIFFNIPHFKLISYPFSWIWPIYFIALMVFVGLLWFGLAQKKLNIRKMVKAFFPMVCVLILNAVAGLLLWPVIKWWYPWYKDLQHEFTYSGHLYILIIVLWSLSVCLLVYKEYRKISAPNLLVPPIVLWLIICALLNVHMKGASFIVIPLFGLLASLYITMNQKATNSFLIVFLALPAIFIMAPFVKIFPVALGLNAMPITALLTSFIFLFTLPYFAHFRPKRGLAAIFLLVFFFLNIKAHIMADGFTKAGPKPSSLVYYYDFDAMKAFWASYDNVLTYWNSQFIKNNKEKMEGDFLVTDDPYVTKFKHISKTRLKKINPPEIVMQLDTIIGEKRHISLCITHKRTVNRLDVYTNDVSVQQAAVNKQHLSEYYLHNRENNKLFSHFVSNNDFTEIELAFGKNEKMQLVVYETSYDLLENPLFSVPNRPENQIPMPFVLNDAIILKKKVTLD